MAHQPSPVGCPETTTPPVISIRAVSACVVTASARPVSVEARDERDRPVAGLAVAAGFAQLAQKAPDVPAQTAKLHDYLGV